MSAKLKTKHRILLNKRTITLAEVESINAALEARLERFEAALLLNVRQPGSLHVKLPGLFAQWQEYSSLALNFIPTTLASRIGKVSA
jgi:hypothetical protein